MGGIVSELGEREETDRVSLTCVHCGKTETIHVFRERGLPKRMCWECLDCQKLEDPMEGSPTTESGCPHDVEEMR